jgi:hypothetical protein
MSISRKLAAGEKTMLQSVFGSQITYDSVVIHDYKWWPFQPGGITMTPNGEMYWNKVDYVDDFSKADLSKQAWFIHEGAHLYQHYGLHWNVESRGIFDRNYDYVLDPAKTKLSEYGLEQMGNIARDYYILVKGGSIAKTYVLSNYLGLLPIPY